MAAGQEAGAGYLQLNAFAGIFKRFLMIRSMQTVQRLHYE